MPSRLTMLYQRCCTDASLTDRQEIPGLTDVTIPRRLGPKRANNIRKLFNLSKEDDVRQYVLKRPLPAKEGKENAKQRFKSPKIQRLITPARLQVRVLLDWEGGGEFTGQNVLMDCLDRRFVWYL